MMRIIVSTLSFACHPERREGPMHLAGISDAAYKMHRSFAANDAAQDDNKSQREFTKRNLLGGIQ